MLLFSAILLASIFLVALFAFRDKPKFPIDTEEEHSKNESEEEEEDIKPIENQIGIAK